jgi:hypothetical protein
VSPPKDRSEEVMLGFVRKNKKSKFENPFLSKILPDGGVLSVVLWRDQVRDPIL